MPTQKEKQLHIGVLLYGCGHHQAAWLMPDSSVEVSAPSSIIKI